MKNGVFNGRGVLTKTNGEKENGDWKNGEKQ